MVVISISLFVLVGWGGVGRRRRKREGGVLLHAKPLSLCIISNYPVIVMSAVLFHTY